MLPPIPGLIVPDGEIRLEAKVVGGHERAALAMLFRLETDPPQAYVLVVHPAGGMSLLQKEEGQTVVPLAQRTDLGGRLSRNDWNAIGVRLDGPNIWVMLNDEPILSVSDPAFNRGGVAFGVRRLGNLDDNAESAAVFRNLRVSKLAPRQ